MSSISKNSSSENSSLFDNIDHAEITHFNAMAARWWDPKGECKPLHLMNPVRLDYILSRSEGLFAKTVLDVGCGGGILAESMAREEAKVTGLDMSSAALQVARAHAAEGQLPIEYIQETVETHAQKFANHYDVVTCMEMLEHVPDPESVARTCANLVKAGGDVFFSTLNRNVKAWLLAIVGAEYVLRLLPRGTHNAKKFIRPAELIGWMDATQLKEQHITGVHFNPFSEHFYLNSDVSVNYILHARRKN